MPHKTLERRFQRTGNIEYRESETGERILSGYAAVFGKRSEELWGFYEMVDPTAFNKTLADGADVRALFNHDPNLILGRTKSGTCTLSVDATGPRYDIKLPDTQAGRDAWESCKRGDIDGSSFAFEVIKDEWTHDREKDEVVRTLKEVRLRDVSPVTYPAYPDTSAEARSEDFATKIAELRAAQKTTEEPPQGTHDAGLQVHSWRNAFVDIVL